MWTLHLSHVVKPNARPRMPYHARMRSRQRRISTVDINLMLHHADLVSSSRGGCFRCQLRRRLASDLRTLNPDSHQLGHIERIVVIVAESGAVVTVYREYPRI
ncbi:MAG: DUF4258 domain-containing protein [Acidobacteria bacterium]|nr:DUF4258 domain-containing protein [Acidobacteriota bacterium]